jgi:hypothetical protein
MGDFALVRSSKELDGLKPNELPFYFANWDPFNVAESWQRLCADEDFKSGLETVIRLNFGAIKQSFFLPPESGGKRLYDLDICLQACLLTIKDNISFQKNIIDSGIGIDAHDLTDLSSLFGKYGYKKKRYFRDSIAFSLNYLTSSLSRVLSQNNAKTYFCDFMRLFDSPIGTTYNPSYELMQEVIKGSGGELNLDFRYSSVKPSSRITIDFNDQQTRLYLGHDLYGPDFNLGNNFSNTFSKILEEQQPFRENIFLNFTLPMAYDYYFPLVKVSEIKIRKNDGSISTYSQNTQRRAQLKLNNA